MGGRVEVGIGLKAGGEGDCVELEEEGGSGIKDGLTGGQVKSTFKYQFQNELHFHFHHSILF